jgi:hypothetical protein
MGEDSSYGKTTAKCEFTEFLKFCLVSIFRVFLEWLALNAKTLRSFQKPICLYLSEGRNILRDLNLLRLFSFNGLYFRNSYNMSLKKRFAL